MGKRYVDAGARCPYYCSEAPSKIYCEGFQTRQWVHLAWQSERDRKRYKRDYCRGNWEDCPIARIAKGKKPAG